MRREIIHRRLVWSRLIAEADRLELEKSLTRAQSPEIAFDFPRISGRIARDERGSKKFIKMQDETADDACA